MPEAMLDPHGRAADLESLDRAADLDRHEPGCEPVDAGIGHDPLDRWDCLIRDAVMHHFPGVDPAEIKRQIMHESSGIETAVGAAGEIGLMQLKVSTFLAMLPRGDIRDPADNIAAGVMYRQWCADFWLRHLRTETERRGPLSLACYNAGPGRMLDAQSECGGYTWADFGPCAPAVTQRYVLVIFYRLFYRLEKP